MGREAAFCSCVSVPSEMLGIAVKCRNSIGFAIEVLVAIKPIEPRQRRRFKA
jgi:hypothetical protein